MTRLSSVLIRCAATAAFVLLLQPASRADQTPVPPQPAAPVPVLADAPPAAAEPAPDVLSFRQDENNRMAVPVSISGSGPFAFLVDTGAERTVIASELADKLQLGAGHSVVMHSMTEVAQVDTSVIPTLQLSQKTASQQLEAPRLAAANIGAAGMLGVDSLQRQRVMFDFNTQKMSIVPSRKIEQYWGPDAIVITGKRLYGRLVLVDAQVDGQKIIVIVDTGSAVSIGNEALRQRLIAKKRLTSSIPIQLVSVTGGRMSLDYTAVKHIIIGGIDIYDMPIAFADVHPFKQLHLLDRPALLLGMDALHLFQRVSIDFAREQVRLLLPKSGSGTLHDTPSSSESVSSRSLITH